MRTINGPGLMLSQFMSDQPPFNSLEAIAGWAAGLGYKAFMVPIHDRRAIEVTRAAQDDRYAAEIKATLSRHGIVISERSAHRATHHHGEERARRSDDRPADDQCGVVQDEAGRGGGQPRTGVQQ